MNTSEKYIKMCSSAKEVQRQWSYENGNFIFDLFDGEANQWTHMKKEIQAWAMP